MSSQKPLRAMSTEKPRRSAAYWRDFHRDRARRLARTDNPSYSTFGAVPTPNPIVTFIPNRTAPVYSLIQNDGSLVTSYDPTSVQTTAPANTAAERALPARREPYTVPSRTWARAPTGPRTNRPMPTSDAPTSDTELLRRFRERDAADAFHAPVRTAHHRYGATRQARSMSEGQNPRASGSCSTPGRLDGQKESRRRKA